MNCGNCLMERVEVVELVDGVCPKCGAKAIDDAPSTSREPQGVPDDYLGDGVYASYDGYAIALDLRGQDSSTKIFIEPEVFSALLRFAARCGLNQ